MTRSIYEYQISPEELEGRIREEFATAYQDLQKHLESLKPSEEIDTLLILRAYLSTIPLCSIDGGNVESNQIKLETMILNASIEKNVENGYTKETWAKAVQASRLGQSFAQWTIASWQLIPGLGSGVFVQNSELALVQTLDMANLELLLAVTKDQGRKNYDQLLGWGAICSLWDNAENAQRDLELAIDRGMGRICILSAIAKFLYVIRDKFDLSAGLWGSLDASECFLETLKRYGTWLKETAIPAYGSKPVKQDVVANLILNQAKAVEKIVFDKAVLLDQFLGDFEYPTETEETWLKDILENLDKPLLVPYWEKRGAELWEGLKNGKTEN